MSVAASGNFISFDRNISIPFFPNDIFDSDRERILEIVHLIGQREELVLGEFVSRFERKTSAYTGAAHAIAVGSGTGGLNVAVRALGIGPGDEVIVPAFACQPLASSIVNNGARPIFADVDPWRMVMDPADAESLISPRTKAIMPAHTFSIMADMPAFKELKARHGVAIIEDACVAQGAVLDGVASGMWGDIGIFSHFQVKALGGIGEGGTIVTNDRALADRCRMLRNLGQSLSDPCVYDECGQSSRMDEVLAAFLEYRLDRLTERLGRRAAIAAYYTERFSGLLDLGLLPPPSGTNGRCYYVYAVQSDRRDELRSFLASRGIGTHVYYPIPLPMQPAFKELADPTRSYWNSAAASRRNLALPIFAHLTDGQVEFIADSVCNFFSR
jgi:dTDP-4-amino-4,6-dideoxygalactose transaminase